MTFSKRPAEPVDTRFGDGEVARRGDGKLSVREGAVRVRAELPGLLTADGHDAIVAFSFAVAARPEPAERRMLEEALLAGRDVCTREHVAAAFVPGLIAAIRPIVSEARGEELIGEEAHGKLSAALAKAAQGGGFSTGLEVLPPYQVEVDSPSLRRVGREQAERVRAERDQANRLDRLRRVAEVVREFEALRSAAPEVSVNELVPRLAPGDQAAVVEALMAGTGKQAAPLYAVAGPCLLQVDVATGEMTELPVTAEAGPFRSVQEIGTGRLALGARAGVVVQGSAEEVYRIGGVGSALGFNRVVEWEGRLWASHSDVGVVAWEPGKGDAPLMVVEPAALSGGPRMLCVADGRLFCAVGARVVALNRDARVLGTSDDPGAAEGIVALFDADGSLVVVRASGRVEEMETRTLRAVRQDVRSSRVSAAAMMPFYDRGRLVLAGEDGPVTCLSLGDTVVTQYASGHRGLKGLAAWPGWVAAVSGDRQRIVVLDLGRGGDVREVYVGARVRHRVGDITFVR